MAATTPDRGAGEFAGQVVFITGAGAGIGRATAIAFAAEGADVVVTSLPGDDLDETARLAQHHADQQGGRVLALGVDVTDSGQIAAALAQTIDTFGRLDVAFNNAGIEQPPTPLAEIDEDTWDRIVDTDLRSVFLSMRHQIPLMLNTGGGAIINTASGAGVIGIRGGGAYGAAKHGVIGLTKCAALDYADQGIRINAIAPGIIETPMMGRFSGGTDEGRQAVIGQEPVGRMGRPEEIAHTVLWLAGRHGGFTLGQTIVVDGGQTTGIWR